MFGGAEFWYVRNLDPYNAARMNLLMNTADFQDIKDQGFDHVRIVIDPLTVGCGPTGTIKTISPLTDQLNLDALKATVQEANAVDLAVILDFHPVVLNSWHYTNKVAKDLSNVPTYPAAMKWNLCTFAPGTTDFSNHPLIKFWQSFSAEFATFDKELVFFEIMNEPMINFSSANLGNAEPHTEQNLGSRRNEWRQLQLEAVKAIQNHANQDVRDFKIICTSYTSLPRDIDGWRERDGSTEFRGHHPRLEDPGKGPYVYSECNINNVIYAFHVYDPFRYTHFIASGLSNFPDPKYWQSRDYHSQYGEQNPEPPIGWTSVFPEDEANTNFYWERPIGDMIRDLSLFANYTIPIGEDEAIVVAPILITEFGSEKRRMPEQEFAPPFDPDPYPSGFEDKQNLERQRWHYDVRKGLESLNMGWTVFDYTGLNGIWGHHRIHADDNIQQRSTRLPILNKMQDALFEEPRPWQ